MPTYEYQCKECGHRFEIVQSFSEDSLTTCPECSGVLKKVFGNVGITFKGSGFYKTDSRGTSSSSTTSDSSGSSSSSSSDSGSSSGSSSSSSSSATPAPAASSSSTSSSGGSSSSSGGSSGSSHAH
jgi:putative FmdB family regulatory protein